MPSKYGFQSYDELARQFADRRNALYWQHKSNLERLLHVARKIIRDVFDDLFKTNNWHGLIILERRRIAFEKGQRVYEDEVEEKSPLFLTRWHIYNEYDVSCDQNESTKDPILRGRFSNPAIRLAGTMYKVELNTFGRPKFSTYRTHYFNGASEVIDKVLQQELEKVVDEASLQEFEHISLQFANMEYQRSEHPGAESYIEGMHIHYPKFDKK